MHTIFEQHYSSGDAGVSVTLSLAFGYLVVRNMYPLPCVLGVVVFMHVPLII